MIVFILCSLITLGAAGVATFWGDIRVSILALWVVGLGAGGLFLGLGAELLAIIQWIACTLVAISFLFYSVTFGEYGVQDKRPMSKKVTSAIVPSLLGLAFAAVIWLGTYKLPDRLLAGTVTQDAPAVQASNIAAMGRSVIREHLLSIEIMGVMLLLVVVGAGVIARPEAPDA